MPVNPDIARLPNTHDVGDETALVLTHEGFPDENMRDEHQGGWVECLDNLHAYLGG